MLSPHSDRVLEKVVHMLKKLSKGAEHTNASLTEVRHPNPPCPLHHLLNPLPMPPFQPARVWPLSSQISLRGCRVWADGPCEWASDLDGALPTNDAAVCKHRIRGGGCGRVSRQITHPHYCCCTTTSNLSLLMTPSNRPLQGLTVGAIDDTQLMLSGIMATIQSDLHLQHNILRRIQDVVSEILELNRLMVQTQLGALPSQTQQPQEGKQEAAAAQPPVPRVQQEAVPDDWEARDAGDDHSARSPVLLDKSYRAIIGDAVIENANVMVPLFEGLLAASRANSRRASEAAGSQRTSADACGPPASG